MDEKDYKIQVRASEEKQLNRKKMIELFKKTPIPVDELIVNLALYIRSPVIAKFLYVNELYEKIMHTPGIIIEFGVWWGQNLVLFENLRAVYEPYNYTRKIVGFDTFEGYPSISSKDGDNKLASVGGYAVSDNYIEYLEEILDFHEKENTMSHIKKYDLVKGDVVKTIDDYLNDNPGTIIALAYFDLALYEPTKKCLEAIIPYLTKGSVIAMDELNNFEFPGETIAFREVIGLKKYKLIRSRYLPDRTYIIIK